MPQYPDIREERYKKRNDVAIPETVVSQGGEGISEIFEKTNGEEWRASDLTSAGESAYEADVSQYRETKIRPEGKEKVQKLCQWIIKTGLDAENLMTMMKKR